jgi:hypothetical protein
MELLLSSWLVDLYGRLWQCGLPMVSISEHFTFELNVHLLMACMPEFMASHRANGTSGNSQYS